MLKTNTRYVVKVGESESILPIKDEADAQYWTERSEMNPGWVFKEVIASKEHNVCISCEG